MPRIYTCVWNVLMPATWVSGLAAPAPLYYWCRGNFRRPFINHLLKLRASQPARSIDRYGHSLTHSLSHPCWPRAGWVAHWHSAQPARHRSSAAAVCYPCQIYPLELVCRCSRWRQQFPPNQVIPTYHQRITSERAFDHNNERYHRNNNIK